MATDAGRAASAPPERDLYELLEVNDNADLGAIKKAYRRLSVTYHPDKNPSDATRFNAIRDAYEVLSDPWKRVLYDVGGMEAVKEGEQGKLKEGNDRSEKITLSLAEFYTGVHKTVRVRRRVICRRCRKAPDPQRCRGCAACPPKKVVVQWQQGFTIYQQEKMEPSSEDCKQEAHELDVVVDPGTANEDRIFFKHQSDQKPGEIPGHVIIELQEEGAASNWKRRGNDLVRTLRITLREALLGFTRQIRHLDGHTVEVSTTAVTKPGSVIRIEGEGMPVKDVPSQFGNLDLKVEIDFPASFTKSERDELSESSALRRAERGQDVRQRDEL